jgi:hypothetical protein
VVTGRSSLGRWRFGARGVRAATNLPTMARIRERPNPRSSLFVENTQLPKAGHPILRMPGSSDLPVLELMDIDSLDVQGPVFRWKIRETAFLRARDMGANDYLVPILNDVVDRYLQVGKRRREQRERVLCSLWSREKAGGRRDVDQVSPRIRSSGAGSWFVKASYQSTTTFL